jgi:hypothetical protein
MYSLSGHCDVRVLIRRNLPERHKSINHHFQNLLSINTIMTGTKEGTLNSKPVVSKGPDNRSLVWASVFNTKSSEPTTLLSAASALCKQRRSEHLRKGAYKRVHFAPKPVVSCTSFDSNKALNTWYGDVDYQVFMTDCRNTVRKAQDLLLTTGDWSLMDPSQESLLGLEHFLSPTLERARQERCKSHARRVLATQRSDTELRKRANVTSALLQGIEILDQVSSVFQGQGTQGDD